MCWKNRENQWRRSALYSALPAHVLRRRPNGPFECPSANVIDLLLHGARERHDLHGYADQVLLRHLAVFEPRLGDRRDHALLDLGAGPAAGEFGQLLDMETRNVHAAALKMDFEDFDLFRLKRQIHEKDFVEASFADHLGGKQVDAVRRRCDKESASLFLHPRQEESENSALFSA